MVSQCFHLNFSVLDIIQGTEPLLLPGDLIKVDRFKKERVQPSWKILLNLGLAPRMAQVFKRQV